MKAGPSFDTKSPDLVSVVKTTSVMSQNSYDHNRDGLRGILSDECSSWLDVIRFGQFRSDGPAAAVGSISFTAGIST